MAITRFAAVTDALITAVKAQTTASVFDAVPVTDEFLGRVVVIGARSDDDRGLGGTIRQSYRDLGAAATREETGTIYCSAIAQTGNDDVAGMRAAAIALLGEVETALRSNFDLDVAAVRSVEVELGDVFQGRTPAGAFAEVQFTVTYQALI